MKTIFSRIALASLALMLMAPVLSAQDLGAVRTRMEQRISQLDSLKASGAIGENNRGFVEVRKDSGDASSVVAAENGDRDIVYQSIAKKTGSSPEQVGEARARQIASNSASGVWLQREIGTWYQK